MMKKHSKKHPGFAAVAKSIERREGVSEERADAILAASTRRAGKKARKANPRLNRVKGAFNAAAKMASK